MSNIYIHEELGLTKEQARQIEAEIFEIFLKKERISQALREMGDRFDPETLFRGIKIFQLIMINSKKEMSLTTVNVKPELN